MCEPAPKTLVGVMRSRDGQLVYVEARCWLTGSEALRLAYGRRRI